MYLLIALLLAILFCGKLFVGNTNSKAYDRARNAKKERQEDWYSKYTDAEYEVNLLQYMNNPDNQEKIWNKIHPALLEMSHWKDESGWIFSYEQIDPTIKHYDMQRKMVTKHRNVAVDIILALKGKISFISTTEREAYLRTGDTITKYKNFELAEWIQKQLKRKGVCLELYYKIDNAGLDWYVWEGSPSCSDDSLFKEFSRELLYENFKL